MFIHRVVPTVFAMGLAAVANAAPRSFVSIVGSDVNVSSSCAATAPCRNIAAALSVTDTGGEIITLTSGGYEGANLNKSVSVIAPPGIHAGINVSTGTGLTIDTSGVTVVLRGLNIHGIGGNHGVAMSNGVMLSIEHCVISGMRSAGVSVTTPAVVRIYDTIIRDQGAGGLRLSNGARADIARSKFLGNAYGAVVVETNTPGTTTRASVSESMVVGIKDGADWGISAESYHASASAQVEVIRSTISNTTKGVVAYSTLGGPSVAVLSRSRVTGNTTGLEQLGGGSVFRTRANNSVHANAANSSGTLTPLAGM